MKFVLGGSYSAPSLKEIADVELARGSGSKYIEYNSSEVLKS